MAEDKQKPVIFLVHGAWHRPLHYRLLIHALQAKGFTVLAPPLASSGYDDSVDGKTYHDDVKRVHEALLPFLDEGRIAIGIGHSYGGVPLTVAIQGHTVAERAAKGLKGGVASAIYISATPVIAKGISMYESVGNKYTSDWLHEVSVCTPPAADQPEHLLTSYYRRNASLLFRTLHRMHSTLMSRSP